MLLGRASWSLARCRDFCHKTRWFTIYLAWRLSCRQASRTWTSAPSSPCCSVLCLGRTAAPAVPVFCTRKHGQHKTKRKGRLKIPKVRDSEQKELCRASPTEWSGAWTPEHVASQTRGKITGEKLASKLVPNLGNVVEIRLTTERRNP
jgi:hypothetical protein